MADRPLVLHVRVVTGTGGGPDKTILNSPRHLRQFGYDCALAYLHPPDDPGFATLQEKARSLDAEMISVPDRGLADLSVARRLLRICRERNVTIWHGHDYKSDTLGLLLARFHPMRLVTTVHGWGVKSRKTPLYYAVDRACLKHYERVVCVSDQLLRDCVTAGVPVDRCCEIENAIDFGAYERQVSKEDARRALGLPVERTVIGTVGRLSKEKAFDDLIRSVDQLIESGTPATLLIAGEGPERSTLEALIRELGRENDVRLLGHVADPRAVFAALDVFALSSMSEGLPNVLLEAMASGVPVVSTSVGGIPNVISDDVTGLLIPAGQPEAMTVALTRLLHNNALSQSLAANALTMIRSRYSFEFRMRKMVALYDELRQEPTRLFRLPESEISAIETDEDPDDSVDPESIETISEEDWSNSLAGATLDTIEAGSAFQSSSALSGSASTSVTKPITNSMPGRRMPAVVRRAIHVELASSMAAWDPWLRMRGVSGFYQQSAWLRVLQSGLQHQPVCLQALEGQKLVGVLPMAFVRSRLFGRFLVSLPYLNSSGIVADSEEAKRALIDRAMEFADLLQVRYLELRQEERIDHPKLTEAVTDKVLMRLALPDSADRLWDAIGSKVRNQVRKAQKNEALTVHWGQHDVLDEFYNVFCRNMRDLGTPPFSRTLFASILTEFPEVAEICCVRLDGQPVASGLLIHGPGSTEVPSASSLRSANSSNCNMLLYWSLLTRAIERGQAVFDFGRSSRDSGTYRFKAQWGAVESPAVWQHYVREGRANDMRPGSGRFDQLIKAWQRLPVWLTRVIGPSIVRGIP